MSMHLNIHERWTAYSLSFPLPSPPTPLPLPLVHILAGSEDQGRDIAVIVQHCGITRLCGCWVTLVHCAPPQSPGRLHPYLVHLYAQPHPTPTPLHPHTLYTYHTPHIPHTHHTPPPTHTHKHHVFMHAIGITCVLDCWEHAKWQSREQPCNQHISRQRYDEVLKGAFVLWTAQAKHEFRWCVTWVILQVTCSL